MLHENILLIRDESSFGDVYNELKLHFDKTQVSVKDIITERVFQEVKKYNDKATEYKHALVVPRKEERLLNKNLKRNNVNPEKQVDAAIDAFGNNGFFILVDDLQVEDLDQVVTIKPYTVVTFVKLTQLVGG